MGIRDRFWMRYHKQVLAGKREDMKKRFKEAWDKKGEHEKVE